MREGPAMGMAPGRLTEIDISQAMWETGDWEAQPGYEQ